MGLPDQELQPRAVGPREGAPAVSFIPADVLELPGDEPDWLNFHHTAVQVSATETAEGTAYSAVFEHKPLQGPAFFDLLCHIAPDTFCDEPSATWFDWRLPERPNHVSPGRNNAELIQRHARHLGKHWVDFEGSRSDFMAALVSGHDPTRLTKDVEHERLLLRDETALRDRLDPQRLNLRRFQEMFDVEGLPDPTAAIASYMREDSAISAKTYRQMLKGCKQRTMSAIFNKDRERYGGRYLNELDDGQQETAFDTYVQDRYLAVTMEDGTVRYVAKSKAQRANQAELQEAYERRQPIYLPGMRKPPADPATYVIDRTILDAAGESIIVCFPHTIRPSRHSLALQPVLEWRTTTRDGGTRRRELVIDEKVEDPPDGPIDQPRVRASRLTGLLVLAHLSPGIRKGWPETIRLGGEGPPQDMGPAQVPLLALMQRHSLLKSPVIELMESLSSAS